MKKYNLTFGQRLLLPLLWLIWVTSDPDKRKTWHEVKKSMEPHVCRHTRPFYEHGYLWFNCDHEGCNVCTPDEHLGKYWSVRDQKHI